MSEEIFESVSCRKCMETMLYDEEDSNYIEYWSFQCPKCGLIVDIDLKHAIM